jgi:hypothetical protein
LFQDDDYPKVYHYLKVENSQISMKKLFLLMTMALIAVSVSAQPHFKVASNPDILRHAGPIFQSRMNIVLPQVNGYTPYKADLHIHSIYSDAHVTPQHRVREAWNDGLDVLSLTEHIEYRGLEPDMIKFMKNYIKDDAEAINWSIVAEPADKRGIQTDLNLPVRLAQEEAKKWGITIIPGAEISREPEKYGHFNVLFTTDNNLIYDPDPIQSMKNAKAQGALVVHNHPGWRRTSLDMIDFEKIIYPSGILDGIEVMNHLDFYPRALDRAKDYNLFLASNTDMHDTTYEFYRLNGALRNMTIIFAKDKSLESLKEAIKAHRTLAYSFGTIAGEKHLLEDFFRASVECEVIAVDANGARTYELRNNTSLPYYLNYSGDPMVLDPFCQLRTVVAKDKVLRIHVQNMWYSSTEQLVVEVK